MNTLSVHHDDAATMTVTGHLTELRKRLIIAIIATAIGMAVSDYFLDEIMDFLTAPAGKLYFIKPAEAFFIYFKVCLTAGAIIASPVLFYEFWAFLVPAFTSHEKKVLAALVPSSLILFLINRIGYPLRNNRFLQQISCSDTKKTQDLDDRLD